MNSRSMFARSTFARIWPLTLTQACTALTDNMVRNAVIVLALFRLGAGGTGLAALAGALLMAPYIFLSATAGQIADRFAKPGLIRITKIAELLVMLGTGAAFVTQSLPGLLAAIFCLGTQAAIFGPLKYGILPELLAEDALVSGNAIVEGTTFLAIVVGTIVGGALILAPHGTILVSAVGIVVALLGLYGAMRVPSLPAAAPTLHIGANFIAETWRTTRHALAVRPIRRSILGLSWFWTVGATLLTELPVITRDTLGAEGQVLTLLLTVFAVGVGAGSFGCARLLHGDVSARHVPLAALGITVFLVDFAYACAGFPAGHLVTIWQILAAPAGWRVLADLFLMAASGGIFSVPLYAIMQHRSEAIHRARIIAAYPGLDETTLDLVVLYAEANPVRGRPRRFADRAMIDGGLGPCQLRCGRAARPPARSGREPSGGRPVPAERPNCLSHPTGTPDGPGRRGRRRFTAQAAPATRAASFGWSDTVSQIWAKRSW